MWVSYNGREGLYASHDSKPTSVGVNASVWESFYECLTASKELTKADNKGLIFRPALLAGCKEDA